MRDRSRWIALLIVFIGLLITAVSTHTQGWASDVEWALGWTIVVGGVTLLWHQIKII